MARCLTLYTSVARSLIETSEFRIQISTLASRNISGYTSGKIFKKCVNVNCYYYYYIITVQVLTLYH